MMRRLQQGIEQQQTLFTSSQQKEFRLLDELAAITARLKIERTRLETLEQQLAVQQQDIELQQEKLVELTDSKKKLQQHVEKRLAAYYRMGRMGFLNAIFSSSGLSSLIRFDEAFQLMLQRDRLAAGHYQTKIRESEQATDQLREQQEILTALVPEVRRQEQQYSQSKKEREALLHRVKTQKQLYGAALRELQSAAEELTDRLNQLKQEALAEARQDESLQENSQQEEKPFFPGLSFADQKGKLAPPVDGTVTKTFGKSTTKKFGLTLQTNGITIAAPTGSAIKAIYYGRVVYVGELKGYGNIIILDHDHQYYSLVSRAEKYFKRKGDMVMPGEVIGVAGDESGLLENGLHFEIRKGTKPLDPLEWLRPGSLKIASGS
ncbi:MAG: peptidoglycan DD-metalloendopeptidase family protein [Deltaproteobacteria bacterium]